jgi:hypothetical protein
MPTTTATKFQPQPATLQHANARLLRRYADWADYMLTVTFKPGAFGQMPNIDQVHAELRYLSCTLNAAIWHNKTRFNEKCQILFIPVVEGAKSETRIHAHILLGNVKDKQTVDDFMQNYVRCKARWLAERYDISEVTNADGVCWYLAKETNRENEDAVAWQLASIPKQLLPR